MDMYPDNEEIMMDGEKVVYPGVDENGKFTNGDFNDPMNPPSFIPAETINLLLDNMAGLVRAFGGIPNNRDPDQLAKAVAEISPALAKAKHGSSSGASVIYPTGKARFVTFDFDDPNHRSVKIAKDVHVRLDITTPDGTETRWLDTDDVMHIDLDDGIREAVARTSTRIGHDEGRDFYGYIVPDFDTADGVKIVVSCNATYPNDISEAYTAANTRKLFSFHTLCADVGEEQTADIIDDKSGGLVVGSRVPVKRYSSDDEDGFYDFYNVQVCSVYSAPTYDQVTVLHPLAGFLAGQILPESVFCISFRPKCKPAGMVYDIDTDIAVDIYLVSGFMRGCASEFSAKIQIDRKYYEIQKSLRCVGKRLLYDHEFSSISWGTSPVTIGTSMPTTTGGHGRISFIGCEDCCGVVRQVLGPIFGTAGSALSLAPAAGIGRLVGGFHCLCGGGSYNAASPGPESRDICGYQDTIAARGASKMKYIN